MYSFQEYLILFLDEPKYLDYYYKETVPASQVLNVANKKIKNEVEQSRRLIVSSLLDQDAVPCRKPPAGNAGQAGIFSATPLYCPTHKPHRVLTVYCLVPYSSFR
jgi:hypothetical protein